MTELMAVLVIFGLVLTASVPQLSRYIRHDRVRTAADEFRNVCLLAQKRATATRNRHRVNFDNDAACYYIERREGELWVMASSDTVHAPAGVQMLGMSGGDPSNTVITFEPLGTIATSDTPAIVQFFNSEHDSSSVSVVRTGRIAVRYN
jgi:Tfp pilus assembly protein FimT